MTQNTDGFKSIKTSSNKAVNDLARQQERCLLELVAHKDNPFKDKWAYAEWHREAVALQLSCRQRNKIIIDNKALWSYLLEGSKSPDGKETTAQERDFYIFVIHNFMEKTFTEARRELAEREKGKDDEPA